jgi:aminoglycoside phosphotransferase (APT) family kinase protein
LPRAGSSSGGAHDLRGDQRDSFGQAGRTSRKPQAKLTLLLVSPANGRPVLAVKAPTTDAAALAVEAERRLLAGLEALAPRSVVETLPRSVDVVEFDGRPAAVMTAVPGTPMTTSYLGWRHTAGRARVAADFAAAAAWLAQLQSGTAGQAAPIDIDGGVVSRLRSRFEDDRQLPGDLDRLAEIHARLRRHTVPRTAVHGDFWFGNLLLAGGQVSGVVDWEAGAETGEPVRDLVRFALMYALYLDWRTRPRRRVAGHAGLRADSWGAGIQYALDGAGWFCDLIRKFIGDGLARLGAPPASWRDAALAGIAEVAALTDDEVFARRHIELFRRIAGSESRRKAGQ